LNFFSKSKDNTKYIPQTLADFKDIAAQMNSND